MIVGGLEEIRIDEAANEIYVADNYLGGRVLVFDLNTLAFKRGWGAYGKPLVADQHRRRDARVQAERADGRRTSSATSPSTSRTTGCVYAADRVGNRIHVTDKQGKFIQEFPLAVHDGRRRRDRAAWGSRPTRSSGTCSSLI